MPARAHSKVSRLARGQVALHDVRAGSSIVAVEGDLRVEFRDRSLAWLGEATPPATLTLHEGECFVTKQRGLLWISATSKTPYCANHKSDNLSDNHSAIHCADHATSHSAAFALDEARSRNPLKELASRAARQVAAFVKVALRRAA